MKGFNEASEAIESICREIIAKLQSQIKTPEDKRAGEKTIQLWKDQDSVISVLEKITAIFSRIRGKTIHAEDEDLTLDSTDVKIVMDFCDNYLKNKNPRT